MAKQNKVDANQVVASTGFPTKFGTEKELQKFYKQLDTATLETWAASLGVDYKECHDSLAIHRMRVCMAILYSYFPKQTVAKQESPYKKYSTEELVQMAVDNSVAFEVADDDRINRMRVIMALRANKVIG